MESRRKVIEHLEARIKTLELFSHPPIDWEKRIESLEDAYMKLYNLLKDKIKGKQ